MSSPNIEKTITSRQAFIFKDLKSPYFNPKWHFHPEFQISYIIKGKGTRFIGDHVQTFKEGDLVLTPPNLPHLWRSEEAYFEKNNPLGTHAMVIYFDQELMSPPLLRREEFYTLRKLVENASRGIEFYGSTPRDVYRLMQGIPPKKGFKRIINLLEILEVMADSETYNLLSSPGYTGVFKTNDAEKMHLVYDYVMKHFTTKIELQDVADLLNMTTTSFCRYFKPRANKTFTRFVNEIRIGHARKLLLEDNFNISQISYECGFNTLSNFNRQFKSIVEMSPHEYQKLFLNIKAGIS
ncbi:AraC family transcriptional regulator [Pricia sp. S334]|uniref:AraC family transcriptional regulator n=1 Tax=Pricia mediterranea TaxID=3076079 RepID=A0ABU3L6I1_9FLAO|nr:AraC family transcriptional regulator [Pricia sp. S334]MDT7829355.1 AraC family transcriptional regulator [Pricia sp. S334]